MGLGWDLVHNKAKKKVVNNTQVGVSTQAQTGNNKGPYELEEVRALNVDNSWD
jgi:hypothetical protein